MAVLTAARFNAICDAVAAVRNQAKGAGTAGLGVGATEEPSDDFGARGRLGDLNAVLMGYAEDDYLPLMAGVRASIDKAGVEVWSERVLPDTLDALDELCAAAGLTGVSSATGFALYYNTGAGGPYNALQSPDFGRGAYFDANGQNLDARNVFSPAVASLATKVVGGVFTSVATIDTTKYAGAARSFITVATLTGTGTAIVTGSARNSAGVVVTGRTFSAEIADGTATLLVPQNAGDLLVSVTAITLDAGITVGTATVSCAVPSGRTDPPV